MPSPPKSRSSNAKAKHNDSENVLLVGGPGGGKRTMLTRWVEQGRVNKENKLDFGIQLRFLKSGQTLFTSFGVEGHKSIVSLARAHCHKIGFVLYMVDATDDVAIAKARLDLHEIAKGEAFEHSVFIVAANKSDDRRAMDTKLMVRFNKLHLQGLRQEAHCIPVSCKNNTGVRELYYAVLPARLGGGYHPVEHAHDLLHDSDHADSRTASKESRSHSKEGSPSKDHSASHSPGKSHAKSSGYTSREAATEANTKANASPRGKEGKPISPREMVAALKNGSGGYNSGERRPSQLDPTIRQAPAAARASTPDAKKEEKAKLRAALNFGAGGLEASGTSKKFAGPSQTSVAKDAALGPQHWGNRGDRGN